MTFQIQFEEPPEDTSPELAAWLQRQIFAIQEALEQRLDLDTDIVLDEKPLDGMLRYLENGPEGPGFYGRINGVWVRFGISGDVLIGYYDQVADLVSNGPYDGLALPLATDVGLDDRQYMVLSNNGTFTTIHPNLAGKTGGVGDVIRVFDGVWELEDISSAYLSSVVDDTANGHITLVKTPTLPGHAAQLGQVQDAEARSNAYADAGDATRLPLAGGQMSGTIDMNQNKITDLPIPIGNNEAARLRDVTAVQSNLDTHIGHTASANDVHGTKTYTDQQVTTVQGNLDTHVGHTAEINDVHGTKTYTDQQVNALRNAVLEHMVAAAYGGLAQTTQPAAPDIPTLTYVTIPFSEFSVTDPSGITPSVGNNTLAINEEGIYTMSISMSLEHIDSQQGRMVNLRIYNVTSGAPTGVLVPVGIGRNQPATVFSWTLMFEAGVDIINNELRLEIGGTSDSVNVTQWSAIEWNAFHVSEYKGTLV